MMGVYDPHWVIRRGATARRNFQIQRRNTSNVLVNQDITGATFVCKLRPTLASDTVIATATGSIVTAADGLMKLEIDETVTADLEPGSGVWDCYMTLSPDVEFVAGGTYTIVERVSR